MENMKNRSFSELLSELRDLADEVAGFAKNSEIEVDMFTEFAMLVEKFPPIFNDIRDKSTVFDKPPIRKSLESLENELRRAKALTKSSNLRQPIKQIEDITHDIGRSLGIVLVASLEMSADFREKIGELQRQLMNARYADNWSLSSSPISESVSSDRKVNWEIEEEIINVTIGDVVLQLKNGNDEEFAIALSRLKEFIRNENYDAGLINEEAIVAILFNRLSSCQADNRLAIIQLLRSISSANDEKKENMADIESLSKVVKSLTRDAQERREAVGLLLELSVLSEVRRRIGRIKGCIVMLVTILNADDPIASHDAAMLLEILSSNTQNALHMAEAGYFTPLVQYLKEGDAKHSLIHSSFHFSVIFKHHPLINYTSNLKTLLNLIFTTS